jgi:hypothetical protein
MDTEAEAVRFPALRNWVSAVGLVIFFASVFAFLLLFVLDTLQGSENPYVGVLTYLVAPFFMALGLGLVVLGVLLRRRQLARYGAAPTRLVIDVARRRDRVALALLLAGGVAFFLLTAVGSYGTFQFTESVTFCGQTCHTVMEPEWVTYQHSPHARVRCAECHIGPGADWWVRSKLSGLYQVYAVLADRYPRPIPTPIENLRPSRDTCEECHWRERASGNLVRTYWSHLSDEENTPWGVSLLLRVGGGDPRRGSVDGIHWHTSSKVEYLATDERRLQIPWVRLTNATGQVTEYRTPEFTGEPDSSRVRVMDCMDCHNRPAHTMNSPHEAVDRALLTGRIDPSLPGIRRRASELLAGVYETEAQALDTIASGLEAAYPGDARVRDAIPVVQRIYTDNFFPEMKASWKDYPEHVGHKIWPGCTRCHDDQHRSEDGTRTISFRNCDTCHLILAQGSGPELEKSLALGGQPFDHPLIPYDTSFRCVECHTGGP